MLALLKEHLHSLSYVTLLQVLQHIIMVSVKDLHSKISYIIQSTITCGCAILRPPKEYSYIWLTHIHLHLLHLPVNVLPRIPHQTSDHSVNVNVGNDSHVIAFIIYKCSALFDTDHT
jgi:hypothetical protein